MDQLIPKIKYGGVKMACIKCGGDGTKGDGTPCDCGAGKALNLPVIYDIPEQYQQSIFDKSFLPNWLLPAYGIALQEVIDKVRTTFEYKQNLLICAPPNSGKTTFAYTLQRLIAGGNLSMSPIYDLNETKKLMTDLYGHAEEYDEFVNCGLAIVKLPMDLPNKFVEMMMTIIDLRCRHSGTTIFLYDGTKEDLENIDRFDKLDYIIGDGNYHTVKVHSYFKPREKKKISEEMD